MIITIAIDLIYVSLLILLIPFISSMHDFSISGQKEEPSRDWAGRVFWICFLLFPDIRKPPGLPGGFLVIELSFDSDSPSAYASVSSSSSFLMNQASLTTSSAFTNSMCPLVGGEGGVSVGSVTFSLPSFSVTS